MKEKFSNKNKDIDKKDMDEVFGGKSITYNSDYLGDGNVIGTNASYEQMLSAIDRLNKSGSLDYLKKK